MTRFTVLLLTAIALLLYCEPVLSQQPDTVAIVANRYTISFPELMQFVHDYQYYYRYNRNISEAADSALSDMVLNRLKIIDFFERGFDKDRRLLQGMMRMLNEELVAEYYRVHFFQKYVNEEALQNEYRQMGKKVVYRQILLRKPEGASEGSLDSLRSLAERIKMQIDGGADFSYLAKRYSGGWSSVNEGSLVSPVNWKQALSWNGYDTIFNLPAGRTAMLKTDKAFYVVQVEKIDTVSVPPYSEVREDILKALSEKYEYVASNQFDQMKKHIVDEGTVRWNEDGVKKLLYWSNIPDFYRSVYLDTLENAISHGDNFLIMKYSKRKVDLAEYLHLIENVLILGKNPGLKEDDLKRFILEAVRTGKIAETARDLGLEKDILNPGTKDPGLENGIVRAYDSRMIEKRIPPVSREALRAFYEENRSSLYYQLAKVNIYALVDSSRSRFEAMMKRFELGVPFEKLAHKILVKTFIRQRDGTIASYLSTEPPYLGKAAFMLKLYRTAGPIEYKDTSGGKWYALIKCMAVRKERQLTFADVRKTIANDFADYYRTKIAHSVARQLRKKYPVTINKNVLRQDLSEIGTGIQL